MSDTLIDFIFAALKLRYGEQDREAAEFIAAYIPTKFNQTAFSREDFGEKMAVRMLDYAPPIGSYEMTTAQFRRCIDCAYDIYASVPPVRESNNLLSDSDLSALDYELWKRISYDGAPPSNGEYEIRLEDGQITRASYNADYHVFAVGDGEVHLREVEWRDIFPASPTERAARLYLAQHRKLKSIQAA